MTYKDILDKAPKEYCQRVARRLGLANRVSVSVLREQILGKLLNPPVLKHLVSRLGPYERSVLTMLTFSCGQTGVPFHLFNRKLNQMSRGWTNTSGEVLRILGESGLVFTRTVGNWQHHYIIPEDLRLLLLELFAGEMNDALVSPPKTPKHVRNDGLALIRDTFTFLCFASQSGIRLTQHQSIYKRTQQRLLKSFEVPDDTRKVYARINPTEGNTDRLDFIYRFCWRQKLIRWDDSHLRCSPAGRAWIRKPDGEKIADIYNDWVSDAASGEQQISTALSILSVIAPDRWVCLSSIQEQVSKLGVDAIWTQTLYSRLEREFVNHFTYMGGIAFAPLKDDIAIQVTDLGRRLLCGKTIESYASESFFIVQPNHEILASSYLAPEVRWTLNHIADLHQVNQLGTYKLSPQSVYDGLRSGFTLDDLLTFLETHSKTGLPQNVEISIKEWTERYGQIYLMDVMLLRCKNEALAQEMKASKQIRNYILGEISPTALVVSRRKYKKLLSLLEKGHYMPLPEVVTFETE